MDEFTFPSIASICDIIINANGYDLSLIDPQYAMERDLEYAFIFTPKAAFDYVINLEDI